MSRYRSGGAAGGLRSAVRTGNLVYTAGQLPLGQASWWDRLKLGADVSGGGRALARMLRAQCAGSRSLVDLDAVTRVVKSSGLSLSAPGFHGQPGVIKDTPICWPRCSIAARMRVRRSAYRAAFGCAGGIELIVKSASSRCRRQLSR